MADFIKTQTSFANGEVAPEFYSRDDINGLSKLENMDVLSGGGLSRRAGLTHVSDLPSAARLIPFSVAESQDYILALMDGCIYIFHNDALYQMLQSPWDYDALSHLQYAQRFGTMIFVHPDFPPYTLRLGANGFDLLQFSFSRNDADMTLNIPFMKFDDASDIKITVTSNSAGNNFATFTTNQDFWTPDNVNGRLYLLDKQWVITEYTSPTQVVAYTNGAYTLPTGPISDWRESVFSTRRGWPCSITFHQDRLVFGGSRDWPGGVWLSKVGQHNNFDVGTGLDDEAIFITLLSQQRQQICTVVSSDNLQILTSVGEWAISNKPLTPSSVDIKQHTSVGSFMGRYLPPQKIEGATVFMSSGGRDIRELSLDELNENYNANDLCAFAKHLITSPTDLSYNAATHQLFVVRSDGKMAVLNQNSALGISAWGMYQTHGNFVSVASIDGVTYVVVSRDGMACLERFDATAMQDAGKYNFAFRASAIPFRASGHNPHRLKLRKISARVWNTKSISINGSRITLPNDIYNDRHSGYCGDVSLSQLGTIRDCINAPWTIHGADTYPLTVLSVTMHGWYSV